VQHRRASQKLHKQDWCVLRSIQSPCCHGAWKEQKHLPNFSAPDLSFLFSDFY